MLNTHKHYETACRAYVWSSFTPEKRAERECAYFDEICAEFADSPEVVAKFERLFLLSLTAKSRCASSMITGPARFPVEKQRKASEREHKISGEMIAYIDRVRKAKAQEAYYAAHPEARPVMSSDADAIDRLRQKLAMLQANQDKMILANKLIRKGNHAALQALLPGMTLEEILKPDCFGNVGFATFTLSNNRAAIKQVEGRIKEIENRKATMAKDFVVNGVRCLENTEAMRLQLFFDGKPTREMIDLLKRHAFKWSPTNMAWQRQLTNNAVWTFNHHVLPMLKGAEVGA